MWMLLALIACEPDDAATWDTGAGYGPPVVEHDGMLTTTTWQTETDGDGLVALPVEVGPDTTSFYAWVRTRYADPGLDQIIAPDGTVVFDRADWEDSPFDLTDAHVVDTSSNGVVWPARPDDGPLEPGTWTTVWHSEWDDGDLEPGDPTDAAVITKDDPDLETGTVIVHLVWAAGVDAGPGHAEAVDEALAVWIDEWADLGLEVVPTFHVSDLDPTMPFAPYGDEAVQDLVGEIARPGDVVLILGDSMMYKPGIYGTSLGRPGHLLPSEYAFVAVALDLLVGPTGMQSHDDHRALVDTLSHEVAHYLGLSHAVEQGWDVWDALEDTPMCTSQGACEAELGHNLMYPYSYCDGRCATRTVTDDQRAVLHLTPATR